jgi:hypothetical protein
MSDDSKIVPFPPAAPIEEEPGLSPTEVAAYKEVMRRKYPNGPPSLEEVIAFGRAAVEREARASAHKVVPMNESISLDNLTLEQVRRVGERFAINAFIESMSNEELVAYTAAHLTGRLPFEGEALLQELMSRVNPGWSDPARERPTPPRLPMMLALAKLRTATEFYETFGPPNIGAAVKEPVSRDALTSLIEKALALGKLLQQESPK